jgi:hypothetical protein
MNRADKMFVALVVGAVLVGSASAQTSGTGLFARPTLKLGIQGGFASRGVRWDKGPDESTLKTLLLGLTADVTFARGFGLSLFAGLGSSDPDGAVFRNLPVSLEYGAGAMKGLAFGAAVRKTLVAFGDFETGARAGCVIYSGTSKTWPIEDFAVEGEARGRPKWSEFEIGPTLSYKAIPRFTPYLGLSLNWFKGDFRMTETLGELAGEQVRKFARKGLLRIAAGASFELGRGFFVDGEAGVIPSKGKAGAGATVRLLYGF